MTLLEGELAFMEVGYITRPPSFLFHGAELKLEEPLSAAVPATTPQIDITVQPSRVGLGPGVVLQVACMGRKRAAQVDEFTAWVPCLYLGHPPPEPLIRAHGFASESYADLTIKDLLASLLRIFAQRRGGEWVVEEASAMLQCAGRRLDDDERPDEVFECFDGLGLYSERLELVMDLSPAPPPPPASLAGLDKAAIAGAVEHVVAGMVSEALSHVSSP
jgi:hypothetical protein